MVRYALDYHKPKIAPSKARTVPSVVKEAPPLASQMGVVTSLRGDSSTPSGACLTDAGYL